MSCQNKNVIYFTETDFEKTIQLVNFYYDYLPSHTSCSKIFAELETIMNRALIVEKGKIPKGIAALNSLVVFVDIETGDESHAVLSLPSRDNNAGKKISIFSTFGSTLLGCVQGDLVQHETPEGMRKFFIKSISND